MSEITTVNQKLDRILNILQDDPSIGEDGLVSKVRKHEKRIDKLERDGIKDKATVAGVSAGVGGLIGVVAAKLANIIF